MKDQVAKTVFKPANICIYCKNKSGVLSTEHIIPFSMGGKFELPKASCKSCSTITSKFEMDVARRLYHVVRALYGVQSRRPQKIPKNSPVIIKYGKYGPTEKIYVPLRDALIVAVIPHFILKRQDDTNIYSYIELHARHMPNEDESRRRTDFLLRKYNAHEIVFESGEWKNRSFVRAIWKSMAGFLWIAHQDSYLNSPVGDYITEKQDHICKESMEGKLTAKNIFSVQREP